MDRESVEEWLKGYEDSWRSPGTDHLSRVFAPNSTYRTAPYEDPYRGLAAIADLWDRERSGSDESFTMATRIVAVEGTTAVVQAEVHYAGPPVEDYRDLWVIEFDEHGQCQTFEEWPFTPDRKGWFAPGPEA